MPKHAQNNHHDNQLIISNNEPDTRGENLPEESVLNTENGNDFNIRDYLEIFNKKLDVVFETVSELVNLLKESRTINITKDSEVEIPEFPIRTDDRVGIFNVMLGNQNYLNQVVRVMMIIFLF